MNSRNAPQDPGRRRFLGACCSAVTGLGVLSALAQLRLLGAVANASTGPSLLAGGEDYRALVCLFLQGGNDANNVIVPADAGGYAAYLTARGALALPQGGLLPLAPARSDGRVWGLHPSMTALATLFSGGQAALLANVGTLAVPTTKAQYQSGSVPLPKQLFSHNDQQVEWQSSLPDQNFTTGWGGRLADLTNAVNENPSVSMSISLDGQNSFQVGRTVSQFSVSRTGAVALTGSSSSQTSLAGIRTRALNDVMASPHDQLMAAAFGGLTGDAIADSALVAGAFSGAAPFSTVFPTSSLGQQLSAIARLIAYRSSLGLKRQIFFARIGGWDLHDNQVTAGATDTGAHAGLLADVSASLLAFYQATVELGLAEKVTTFTASDFGRTYTTNGDGSDHGWGSHHFVVGGAVRGGDIYGRMPDLTVNGPDDTGRGRWIPTTSVDEYSATLARWFGVSDSNLPVVLPNIGRFASPDLGFMNA